MALYGVMEQEIDANFDVTSAARVDKVAVAVLHRYHGVMLNSFTPLCSTGKGNCCFRAISLALFGTESPHDYFRLQTAFEIIENRAFYDVRSKEFLGGRREERVETPTYREVISDVTVLGTPVSLIHPYGISAAFGIPIQSYIPPTPSVGLGLSPYTVKVVGRNIRQQKDVRMTVMWTPALMPRADEPLVANHIVLLAQRR